MPLSRLSAEQSEAAAATTAPGGQVIVSAGAGSGKTTLLVGRYLHLLRSARVDMSSVAAITFTNKAADQMKDRIARSAREFASNGDGSREFWLDVASRAHRAPISTIHAFCNTILRSYPVEAGCDPRYAVTDETTRSELVDETIDAFFRERLDDDPERMMSMLRTFGVHDYKRLLRSMLGERVRLTKYLDGHPDLTAAEIEGAIIAFIRDRVDGDLAMLRDFHVLRPGDDSLADTLDELVHGLGTLSSSLATGDIDIDTMAGVVVLVRGTRARGSAKKWGMDPGPVRHAMKGTVEFLERALDFARTERGVIGGVIAALMDEYGMLEERFSARKRSRSLIDHDDALIETWRLLRRNAAVCRAVSSAYSHILVDEFQDTDGIQMDIIGMIAGNSAANLFTVGDPKQSIYRFRGADVSIFNEFMARRDVSFKSLKTNYRSSPALVGFVNAVFTRVIGSDEPEHPFEAVYRDMKANRKDGAVEVPVEVAVFDSPSSSVARAAEADFIARRAREIHERHGYPYGEMAVLVRKSTHTGVYEQALLSRDIPFVNQAQGNPLDSPEATDVAHLLGWLCEPGDDTLFCGLMLSPFFGASPALLRDLRGEAGPDGSMAQALMISATAGDPLRERVRRILTALFGMHERVPIREVLERAFDETGYTATLCADPLRGEYSLVLLDLICETADTFEAGGGSIREFARVLMAGELAADGTAAIESNGDALTILTIHRAKGMEYKVVFLADIAARPNSGRPSLLMHDSLGPGLALRGARGDRRETFTRLMAVDLDRMMSVAESKRLFYVGCTRAEDMLVLSGGPPSKDGDPEYGHDNWMTWLHEALDIPTEPGDGDGPSPRNVTYARFEVDTAPSFERAAGRWEGLLSTHAETQPGGERDVPSGNGIGPATAEHDTALERVPTMPPPIPTAGRPGSLSPTGILDLRGRLSAAGSSHAPDDGPVIDDAGKHAGSPARGDGHGVVFGVAAHRVLEHIDFAARDVRHGGIIDSLAGDLPPDMRATLARRIRDFTATPLYARIAESQRKHPDDLRRELPFAFIHDDVLVRGTVDLVFRDDSGLVVVDYKTSAGGLDDPSMLDRWRFQLMLYAHALRRATYETPVELAVHSLAVNRTVTFPCTDGLLDAMAAELSALIGAMTVEGG